MDIINVFVQSLFIEINVEINETEVLLEAPCLCLKKGKVVDC